METTGKFSLFLFPSSLCPHPSLSCGVQNYCSHHCNIRRTSLGTKLTHGEGQNLWIQCLPWIQQSVVDTGSSLPFSPLNITFRYQVSDMWTPPMCSRGKLFGNRHVAQSWPTRYGRKTSGKLTENIFFNYKTNTVKDILFLPRMLPHLYIV